MTLAPSSATGGRADLGGHDGDSVASAHPPKRARHASPDPISPSSQPSHGPSPSDDTPPTDANYASAAAASKAGQSSSFRNVSACNRCRLRKNRCDQRLPSCNSCEKAGVKCVGYDPITKREIPRSYVFYLETRVSYLEGLLLSNKIAFTAAEILDSSSRPGPDPTALTPTDENGPEARATTTATKPTPHVKPHESPAAKTLMANTSNVSTQGVSDPRGSNGISFARVVFAAVKSSINSSNSEKGSQKGAVLTLPTKTSAVSGGTTMRDSFFGLQTKPTIKQASFPDKALGLKLATLFFEHANPQIPILHRGEFMKTLEAAYAEPKERVRGPRELYILNMVFAIGSGIIMDSSEKSDGTAKKSSGNTQCQPEEYHASAIIHLESCLAAAPTSDRWDGIMNGLEELQAVLLLASFALLRPVPPGLWYIVGVAVRFAVDLGLYYEDGKDPDSVEVKLEDASDEPAQNTVRDRGRREWIRDMRRRLWWATYCFDRLVSTCVGRPFGISDQVITTEFPSLLEDKYITPNGLLEPPTGVGSASSKHVAHHYLRLRLLQSEILQVLQHQQVQMARAGGTNQKNSYMHTHLQSPFLIGFPSFRKWRRDIDLRLWQWKESAPTKRETGVQFSTDFLELNYWQAVIMLYRQSLSVPTVFAGEYNTSDEVESQPSNLSSGELREDEERVYLKVAEAGERVLRLYRKLHRVHLVNYTYLATHHLFMAGISFLYAIWHSAVVRSRLSMDEVDFTILGATSVLGDLMDKCPPAEACRDALTRMYKVTVQMCLSTTGFASSSQGLSHRSQSTSRPASTGQDADRPMPAPTGRASNPPNTRPQPTFDMGLNDLAASTIPAVQTQPDRPPGEQLNSPLTPKSEHLIHLETSNESYANQATIPAVRSPTSYSLSPVENSFGQTLMAASPQGNAQFLNTVQSTTSPQGMGNVPFNTTNPPAFPYTGPTLDDMQLHDMNLDFLQGNGFDADVQGGANMQGFDMGMGMGPGLSWDGMDYDLSDGNHTDLFGGFFFGGAGTGGNF